MSETVKSTNNMSGLAIAGLGSSINALGGYVSNLFSSNNVEKQLQAQREENEKNRQFNAKQAVLNRAYQSSQIRDYRQYNSPLNQARLYQQAGYHPMTALGQFGTIDSGLSSGSSAQYSGGVSPVGYNAPDFSNIGSDISTQALQQSQATKNYADAHKTEIEAITKQLQQGADVQLSYVTLRGAEIKNDKEQLEFAEKAFTFNADVGKAYQEYDNLVQLGANMKQDEITKRINNAFESHAFQHKLDVLASQASISKDEAKYCVARIISELTLRSAQVDSLEATVLKDTAISRMVDDERARKTLAWPIELSKLSAETETIELNLEVNEEYLKKQKELEFWNGCVDLATDFKHLVFGKSISVGIPGVGSVSYEY